MITTKILLLSISIFVIQKSDAKIKWHDFWVKTPINEGKCKEGNPPGPKDSDITGDYGGIIPTYYKINLHLPIKDAKVEGTKKGTEGSLNLNFRVKRKTKFIYLMTRDTEVDLKKVYLYFYNPLKSLTKPIKLDYKCLDTVRNSLILRPKKPLVPQKSGDSSFYVLAIKKFKGKIREPYTNGIFETERNALAPIATQFQTDNARFAFPCIDIPQFKTGFELKIFHPPGTIALSNMELKSSGQGKQGWKWDLFLSTPPLPTYLIAFTIQTEKNVKIVKGLTTRNIDLRVLTNSDETELAELLLDDGVFCLNDLWTQLQTPLQLRKLDFVQISGFPFGGMENFGMITLTNHPGGETNRVHLQAHELAHHWFGDMVTVRNWKHLAVQEGLTDYFAYRTVKNHFDFKKDTVIGDLFYMQSVLSAMDGAPSTTLEIDYTPDLTYDTLRKLYGKATFIQGNIDRMVGEEKFLERIREFVREHSYRDFTIDDYVGFFNDILLKTDKGAVSVGEVYRFWFTHGSYPTVMVSRNLTAETAEIYQVATTEFKWLIPLKIQVPKVNLHKSFYPPLINGSVTLNLKGAVSKDEPLVINPEADFFYKVMYDFDGWDLLLSRIAKKPSSFTFRTRVWQLFNFCYYSDEQKGSDKLWKKYGKKIMKQEKDLPEAFFRRCGTPKAKEDMKEIVKKVGDSMKRWKMI